MAKEYKVTAQEKQLVDAVQVQLENAQRAVDHFQKMLDDAKAQLAAMQGSIDHASLLIVKSQGLDVKNTERVEYDPAQGKLVVKDKVSGGKG